MRENRMQGVTSTAIGEVVMVLLYSEGAHTATKYLSDRVVIRATRPTVNEVRNKKRTGKVKLNGADKNDLRAQVVVTVGEPNYEAREFIKACKRSGEPFPVQKIQLRMLPDKKKR